MSQKLPVHGFEWVKDIPSLNKKLKKFIKVINHYDEESLEGYIPKVDIEYPKNLHDLHSDLPFLYERRKTNKCNKLVCNLYDKNNYFVHIRASKEALNHRLVLKMSMEQINLIKKHD